MKTIRSYSISGETAKAFAEHCKRTYGHNKESRLIEALMIFEMENQWHHDTIKTK